MYACECVFILVLCLSSSFAIWSRNRLYFIPSFWKGMSSINHTLSHTNTCSFLRVNWQDNATDSAAVEAEVLLANQTVIAKPTVWFNFTRRKQFRSERPPPPSESGLASHTTWLSECCQTARQLRVLYRKSVCLTPPLWAHGKPKHTHTQVSVNVNLYSSLTRWSCYYNPLWFLLEVNQYVADIFVCKVSVIHSESAVFQSNENLRTAHRYLPVFFRHQFRELDSIRVLRCADSMTQTCTHRTGV